MSSTNAPFGLQPVFHQSGWVRQKSSTVASGYATAIFQYSPVAIQADGTLGAAAAGSRSCGVFLGVQYTSTDNRIVISNQWVASTTYTAGTNVAYYTDDADIDYAIQGSGSIAQTAVGQQFDWTALAGNTTTGLSSVALDIASSAANAGLQVVGLLPGPDNAWGDAFTVVQVRISEHQFRADVAAF